MSQISNQQQAEKVAEVPEYQSLALAAAAVYVQNIVRYGTPNYSWAKYLETFNSEERDAREEFFAKQNRACPKVTSNSSFGQRRSSLGSILPDFAVRI